MRATTPADECLDPAALDALQRRKLGAMLGTLRATNPFYARKLAGHEFNPVTDPIGRLPLTTRADVQADQASHPPYGSNLTFPLDRYVRFHQTSGTTGEPLRWLDTAEDWKWWIGCWESIYRAAGVGAGDRILFPFSFGPFIGFWAAFDAAVALGCLALPGGGLSSTARLQLMADAAATVVCCTPTYALRLAEVARQEGRDLRRSGVRALVVAGEPGGHVPATRQRVEAEWGARVFDHWGMTEIGALAFECREAPDAMHFNEAECIVEALDPATLVPVGDGQPGELVVTNLGRWGRPLIRYRTGDQVRLEHGRCACGRWFVRAAGGIIGRIDDMLIVRGNNVYPSAIEDILRSVPGVAEFRIRVPEAVGAVGLMLEVEPESAADGPRVAEQVVRAVRDRLNFRPEVSVAAPGSLPRFELKARRLVRHSGREPSQAQSDNKP